MTVPLTVKAKDSRQRRIQGEAYLSSKHYADTTAAKA